MKIRENLLEIAETVWYLHDYSAERYTERKWEWRLLVSLESNSKRRRWVMTNQCDGKLYSGRSFEWIFNGNEPSCLEQTDNF